jgi:hypothetical protein
MKIKIPQSRLIPTDSGFVRGQRDVSFDLDTKPAGEFGSQKIDTKFLQIQSDFYMTLDDSDLYTLASYTNRSHQWVTPFIRSGKLPGTVELKMIVQDALLAPLFFQITNYSYWSGTFQNNYFGASDWYYNRFYATNFC